MSHFTNGIFMIKIRHYKHLLSFTMIRSVVSTLNYTKSFKYCTRCISVLVVTHISVDFCVFQVCIKTDFPKLGHI